MKYDYKPASPLAVPLRQQECNNQEQIVLKEI